MPHRSAQRGASACAVLGALACTVLASPPSRAAQVPNDFVDELVVDGLDGPCNFDALPDGRVLLVEQTTARIRLVVADSIAGIDPVGVIGDVENLGPEQGLLGIAVDPRWPASPSVYVFHSVASSPNLRLSRYDLAGDLDGTGDGTLALDAGSRRDILADIPDDFPLHNGGTVMFGPDDMLYVSIGEDGIPCAAQDIHQLRGKILRLNVLPVPAGGGPAPSYQSLAAPGNPYASDPDPRARLVWQRGLRNAFSFDFDQATGAMAIADVGSASYEEVDYATAGGLNFGWPLYEGPLRLDWPCAYADSGAITTPVYWYQRSGPDVEAAVLLGAIYRQPPGSTSGFPFQYASNVFAYDFYEGSLRRLVWNGSGLELAPFVPGQPTVNAWGTGFLFATRMRIGPDGGLWYFQAGSTLRRIRYTGKPVAVDPGPRAAELSLRAYPVPARAHVTLEYDLPVPGSVEVRVVDPKGRLVRRLVAPVPAVGTHRVAWDGRDEQGHLAPAGLYFGVVRSGGTQAVRRLVRVGG